jgi:hypothetical protein
MYLTAKALRGANLKNRATTKHTKNTKVSENIRFQLPLRDFRDLRDKMSALSLVAVLLPCLSGEYYLTRALP